MSAATAVRSVRVSISTILALTAWSCLQATLAVAAVGGGTEGKAPAASATPVRVPFIVGLTTVRAVSTPEGDYETVRVIESVDPSGYRLVVSGEVPGDEGDGPVQIVVRRKVAAADQAAARHIRNYFHSDDDESFAGTVPGFSAAMVNELRAAGKTTITYVEVSELFGSSVVVRELTGVLTRVVDPVTSMPMLVNGRPVQLPVIHARGTLRDGEDQEAFDYVVLADPANPIVLRSSGDDTSAAILRIEFPEPAASPTSIESSLAKNEVATVYGIYFSFNRAVLRPESDRVLKEIAKTLKSHPDWKLRVDGHTDSIGNNKANLDLSRRRADALKAALVTRYAVDGARLTTGGSGESSPQATNATAEGRARNRRVELRRQ
ncbi:MAG: OmpA family protein [Gammaproteobacteria bacterium]